MSGPSTNREDVNTAPIQELSPQVTDFLQNLLQDPSSVANFLPSTPQRQAIESQFARLGGFGPNANGTPGQDILNAATPIFDRNLQQGADVLRQSGSRFNSNTERLVGEQGNKAFQDFNLFSQQVLESGRNRQLQSLLGASQFAGQNRQQNLQLLLPLLQQGLIAGGAASAPVVTQDPGFIGGTLAPIISTLGQTGADIGGILAGAPGTGGGGSPNFSRSGPGIDPATGLPRGFLGG